MFIKFILNKPYKHIIRGEKQMDKTFILHISTITLSAFFAGLSQKFATDKDGKMKLNKVFLIFSFLILFVMMGFRTVGVGVDDNTYNRIFQQVINNGPINVFKANTMEPGYLILNYIISFFTKKFQYALIILTFIPMFLYYKALTYEKKNVNMFLEFFLFGTIIYLYFYGIIRLFIAASIVAYALRYVSEKSTAKYVFMILLATTFHYSAFFMLFLIYFSTEKENEERNMKSLVFIVLIGMPVIIFFASNYIFPNMGERYNAYTTVGSFEFSIDLFDKIPIVLVSLFLYKDIKKFNPRIKLHIVIYSLASVISIYSTIINIGRIQWYLIFSVCILLPDIARAVNRSKYRNFNIILVPLIMIYGILYMYSIYNQTTNICMHEYTNILF